MDQIDDISVRGWKRKSCRAKHGVVGRAGGKIQHVITEKDSHSMKAHYA